MENGFSNAKVGDKKGDPLYIYHEYYEEGQ